MIMFNATVQFLSRMLRDRHPQLLLRSTSKQLFKNFGLDKLGPAVCTQIGLFLSQRHLRADDLMYGDT